MGPAVAARPVQLADVGGVKVLDRHGAPAIVLEHLVVGTAGAAAGDVRGAGGLLEGGGVFADVGPPAFSVTNTCQLPFVLVWLVCRGTGEDRRGEERESEED